MPEMTLGPFILGLDNVSLDTHRPGGTLLEAHNVHIDRSGQVARRPGQRYLVKKTGLHSVWTSRALGLSLAVDNGQVCRARLAEGAWTLDAFGAVEGDGPMSYCDLNGEVVCSNGTGLWRVTPGPDGLALGPLALPRPSLTVEAAGGGGLDKGRYAVAVTFIRRMNPAGEALALMEESAASRIQFAEVDDQGGLTVAVDWPDDDRIAAARVYRSGMGGTKLYRAAEIPAGMASYLVGAGTLGDQCRTLHLAPLPAGSIVRAWRGRLLVANGPVLRFSEPLAYGWHDPRHGFVAFSSPIGIVQPVNAGVYVGTDEGMFFLEGEKPGDWRFVARGGGQPVPGTGTDIPSVEFGADIGKYVDLSELDDYDLVFALWQSDQGLAIGLPDGQVREPQSGRLDLPRPARGALGWFNRRVWMG